MKYLRITLEALLMVALLLCLGLLLQQSPRLFFNQGHSHQSSAIFIHVTDRYGQVWVVKRDSLQQIRPGLIDSNFLCVYTFGTEVPIQIASTNRVAIEKLFGL